MVTKTLTITKEVYDLLKKLKKENESFSDLLKRLTLQINGQKLSQFFGAWDMNDEEFSKINRIIKKRKDINLDKVKLD